MFNEGRKTTYDIGKRKAFDIRPGSTSSPCDRFKGNIVHDDTCEEPLSRLNLGSAWAWV